MCKYAMKHCIDIVALKKLMFSACDFVCNCGGSPGGIGGQISEIQKKMSFAQQGAPSGFSRKGCTDLEERKVCCLWTQLARETVQERICPEKRTLCSQILSLFVTSRQIWLSLQGSST